MRPRMLTRTPTTRLTRSDPRQRQLESLAGEFALLAQRRARVAHQLDLLDQQREVAAAGFARLQTRMALLARCMDALEPDLRDSYAAEPEPPPPPPPPPVKQPLPRFAAAKRGALQARPLGSNWRG